MTLEELEAKALAYGATIRILTSPDTDAIAVAINWRPRSETFYAMAIYLAGDVLDKMNEGHPWFVRYTWEWRGNTLHM